VYKSNFLREQVLRFLSSWYPILQAHSNPRLFPTEVMTQSWLHPPLFDPQGDETTSDWARDENTLIDRGSRVTVLFLYRVWIDVAPANLSIFNTPSFVPSVK